MNDPRFWGPILTHSLNPWWTGTGLISALAVRESCEMIRLETVFFLQRFHIIFHVWKHESARPHVIALNFMTSFWHFQSDLIVCWTTVDKMREICTACGINTGPGCKHIFYGHEMKWSHRNTQFGFLIELMQVWYGQVRTCRRRTLRCLRLQVLLISRIYPHLVRSFYH